MKITINTGRKIGRTQLRALTEQPEPFDDEDEED